MSWGTVARRLDAKAHPTEAKPVRLSQVRALLCILGLVGVVACGQEPTADSRNATRLVVEVRPQGESGPTERRVVTTVPSGISTEDFAPVPPDTACAEIYGGPAQAEVTGTLEGEPIDASFSRVNACEIARWDRVEALLGGASGPTPSG